jgi:hypothetical protein
VGKEVGKGQERPSLNPVVLALHTLSPSRRDTLRSASESHILGMFHPLGEGRCGDKTEGTLNLQFNRAPRECGVQLSLRRPDFQRFPSPLGFLVPPDSFFQGPLIYTWLLEPGFSWWSHLQQMESPSSLSDALVGAGYQP